MHDSNSAQRILRLFVDLAALPLVLLTPFVAFVTYHDYPLFRPEILVCFLGISAIGLLLGLGIVFGGSILRSFLVSGAVVLFVDIQFHWFDPDVKRAVFLFAVLFGFGLLTGVHLTKITSAVFFTMIVSSILLPTEGVPFEAKAKQKRTRAASDLPVILHVVLDEHIGVEGIDESLELGPWLKNKLKAFYLENGFQLFGKAYSRYYDTHYSLGSMFSLEPEVNFGTVLEEEPGPSYFLKRISYFRGMAQKGYSIHVYQTDYIDFCRDSGAKIVSCMTFPAETIRAVEMAPLSWSRKAKIIVSMFGRLTKSYDKAVQFYNGWLRIKAEKLGASLPMWIPFSGRVSPLSSMSAMNAFKDELLKATEGNLYFAHFILPHFPYAYDSQCQIRTMRMEWLSRVDNWVPDTPGLRALRYRHYFEQVACVNGKIEGLFEALRRAGVYEKAIILIHGDHGSRIGVEGYPMVSNADQRSPTDYINSFSTLFAAKGPPYEPGYDLRYRPLDELLLPLLPKWMRETHVRPSSPPYVMLPSRRGDHSGFWPRPVVPFGEMSESSSSAGE